MTVVRYTSDSLREEHVQREIFHHKLADPSHSRATADKSRALAWGGSTPVERSNHVSDREGGKNSKVAESRQRPAVFVQSDPNACWRHLQETCPGR